MWLIAGLGNPGTRYRNTRHNLGFMVADRFAQAQGIKIWRIDFQSRWGRGKSLGEDIVILKPRTYMNLSGDAVRKAVKNFKLEVSQLLVVHDDLDLPFGKIKIATKGGHGGHKGLKSIIEKLGNQEFTRVRIGIGRPKDRDEDVVEWVLKPFCKEEEAQLEKVVDQGREVLEVILTEGVDAAMNRFHGQLIN